jgi:predicted acyltransferase
MTTKAALSSAEARDAVPMPALEPLGPDDKKGRRLPSLDLLRGLTVAGMIVVNATAAFETVMPRVFPVLLHAKWAGFTAADLVFPAFIAMVGVSIAISAKPGRPDAAAARKILARAARLILLGLLLVNMYLPLAPEALWPPRLPGVLQRIAIVFAVAAFVYPYTSTRARAAIAAALLVGYWGLCILPLPDGSLVDLSQQGRNFPSWFDRWAFGSWNAVKGPDGYDPEGLLSTLPAIAQGLLGTVAGDFLRRGIPILRLSLQFVAAGAIAVLLALAWHPFFPIAKPIWTSSFVVLTTGLVLIGLGAFHLAFDSRRSGAKIGTGGLLGSLGRNAVTAYALHLLLIQLMMTQPMQAVALGAGAVVGPQWGALAPVGLFLALIWIPMAVMDRRGWYWRI